LAAFSKIGLAWANHGAEALADGLKSDLTQILARRGMFSMLNVIDRPYDKLKCLDICSAEHRVPYQRSWWLGTASMWYIVRMIEPVASTQSSHGSRARRWVVRGLVTIGAVWVGTHGFIWVANATRSYWRFNKPPAASFSSPDGQFKALVFVSVGGGPATSYCDTSIYVVDSAASNADDRHLVYAASCGGLSEGHWDQSIRWTSESRLEIAFDPTAGASGSTGEVTIRGYAVGGKVHIGYVFKQAGGSW
jgi:hypothetical protein